jgi:hypothetical protein
MRDLKYLYYPTKAVRWIFSITLIFIATTSTLKSYERQFRGRRDAYIPRGGTWYN